jgi:gamma-glutamylcyclotransferase (GGCT)/AIG2-like uncharacterized protein YtfP
MSPTSNVFAYGTLTFAQVMETVTNTVFAHEPALLPGFARYGLRGESYPALIQEATRATDGILWRDVDEASLQQLDAFEGEWYERVIVSTRVGDPPDESAPVQAVTYVLVETQHRRLNRRRWSRDRFEAHHLAQFLRRYRSNPSPSPSQSPR